MNFSHGKGLHLFVALLVMGFCNAVAFAADPIRAKTVESILKPYGPGMVIIIPARTPHFSGSKGDATVVLESGDGATATTPTEQL